MDDLTTLFAAYVQDLRDTLDADVMDSTTLVRKDLPNVWDGSDLNTAYQVALSA
jgi:hypothetical protein